MLFRFKRGTRIRVKIKENYHTPLVYMGMSTVLMKRLAESKAVYRVTASYDRIRKQEVLKSVSYYFLPEDVELA